MLSWDGEIGLIKIMTSPNGKCSQILKINTSVNYKRHDDIYIYIIIITKSTQDQ